MTEAKQKQVGDLVTFYGNLSIVVKLVSSTKVLEYALADSDSPAGCVGRFSEELRVLVNGEEIVTTSCKG